MDSPTDKNPGPFFGTADHYLMNMGIWTECERKKRSDRAVQVLEPSFLTAKTDSMHMYFPARFISSVSVKGVDPLPKPSWVNLCVEPKIFLIFDSIKVRTCSTRSLKNPH